MGFPTYQGIIRTCYGISDHFVQNTTAMKDEPSSGCPKCIAAVHAAADLLFCLLSSQAKDWEETTRFDGSEHWGIDARWKSLFPGRNVPGTFVPVVSLPIQQHYLDHFSLILEFLRFGFPSERCIDSYIYFAENVSTLVLKKRVTIVFFFVGSGRRDRGD